MGLVGRTLTVGVRAAHDVIGHEERRRAGMAHVPPAVEALVVRRDQAATTRQCASEVAIHTWSTSCRDCDVINYAIAA